MKERYEVLKQIRLCLGYSIEDFTKELGFSSCTYVRDVECGKINNVEYIYVRYAKLARVKPSTLKGFISLAESERYSAEEIYEQVKSILRID